MICAASITGDGLFMRLLWQGYGRSRTGGGRKRRQELVHHRRKDVRHLIGKRHHTVLDLDEPAAGNGGSDGRRVRGHC